MAELQLLRAGFVQQLGRPFLSFPPFPNCVNKSNLYFQSTHIARSLFCSRKFRGHPSVLANPIRVPQLHLSFFSEFPYRILDSLFQKCQLPFPEDLQQGFWHLPSSQSLQQLLDSGGQPGFRVKGRWVKVSLVTQAGKNNDSSSWVLLLKGGVR